MKYVVGNYMLSALLWVCGWSQFLIGGVCSWELHAFSFAVGLWLESVSDW